MGGIDRRSVLKAGAWSVPIVVSAVGVPMLAASPPPGVIQIDFFDARSFPGVIQTQLAVRNGGSFDAAPIGPNWTATFSYPTSVLAAGDQTPTITDTTGGWIYSGSTVIGSDRVFTFTRITNPPVKPSDPSTGLAFNLVSATTVVLPFTVTATVSADAAATVGTSKTVTALG
ncbi:hypothetical protein ACDF64_10215 [Agromyces sp. MMS24-JH15]|uniref:hypothetical protein n=1 Tax=Agromyces sp. MMS24-JH15 TaxID=3243765 RepID=UPI0037478CB1